jgi:hypothetical protein
MIRSVTRWCVLGITVCSVAGAVPVAGQTLPHPSRSSRATTPVTTGELYGTVRDTAGRPLPGAVVSAHAATLAFQVADTDGRYAFRSLPPGTYLVRVHLDGYAPPRGTYVQVTAGTRQAWPLAMARLSTPDEPQLLEAGVGAASGISTSRTGDEEQDPSEVAWRLRQIKRGVLKDAQASAPGDDVDGIGAFGRAMGSPARLASSFLADLTLSGQVNLLTITSFDRPEDLFSRNTVTPQPVAYVSLLAPGADGEWNVRGAVTQGDIASWVISGSYTRQAGEPHRYQAGVSYSTQQYQGGNPEALAAMRDGSRTVGELYASDVWTVAPQFTVAVGGRYATYEYLDDPTLLSGRLTLEFQPSPDDPLRLRVSAARREIAPGAEEFAPPATGPWLPPERTFSEFSRGALRSERIAHLELASERELGGAVITVRAFRQQVDDQLVTLFGVPTGPASLGHYYVSTGGDFEHYGWGVGLQRLVGAVRGSVDYTHVAARSRSAIPDDDPLALMAPALRRQAEGIHDLTATLNTRVPMTATQLQMVYKLNNAYATDTDAGTAARFEVQLNQELPFLDFTGARWEMLAAVRNLFRADLFDGSIYDELLVVRPPKRVLGGVTVRF